MNAIRDLIANAVEVSRTPRTRTLKTKAVVRKPSGGSHGRLEKGVRRRQISKRQLDHYSSEKAKLARDMATPR